VEKLNNLETKYNLNGNLDVSLARAELYFYRNQFRKCYEITKRVLEEDPHNHDAIMIVHISTLVELRLKNELFYCAHKLVEENPNLPMSWYGVACYYYLVGNFEHSRRYFSKSTTMDPYFGAGWLGFGHSFAAQGEHDQAMAAYRSASRMLSGCHLASLCIGMELIRVNNFNLAEQYIMQAKEICPGDPLIYNELGVINFKNKDFDKAIRFYLKVLELCAGNNMNNVNETWEPTLFNLGHCYRKIRQYDNAIKYYQHALSVCPGNATTYTALAYTHQLSGDFDAAVEHYHHALGLRAEDSFAVEMLNRCLELMRYDR